MGKAGPFADQAKRDVCNTTLKFHMLHLKMTHWEKETSIIFRFHALNLGRVSMREW